MIKDMLEYTVQDNKKRWYKLTKIAAFILFAIYLFATFRPGVWHSNTFLYWRTDGSFSGSDAYFDYHMTRATVENGTAITFAVDGTERNYLIKTNDTDNDVKIYENNILIFDGSYSYNRLVYSSAFLKSNNIKIEYNTTTSISNYNPKAEYQYPSTKDLYDWATMRFPSLRGNPLFIIGVLLFVADILITIHNPDFYFDLKYSVNLMSDVRNPMPSDWYYSSLEIRRMLMGILIVICVIATFAIHS